MPSLTSVDDSLLEQYARVRAFDPLRARGITNRTLAHFQVEALGDLYTYPVTDESGTVRGYRNKTIPGHACWFKYRWDPRRPYLAHPELLYAVGTLAPGSPALLVAGEPDAWLMHSLNIPAVSLLGGEGARPRGEALQQLLAAAPSMVYVIYDNDEAGRRGGGRVGQDLHEVGITVEVLRLPDSLPDKGDVTDLYAACGRDRARFLKALASLESVPLPAPQPARAPGIETRDSTADSPYAQFKADHPLIDVVGEVVQLRDAGGGKMVGRCPFHADRSPSFYAYGDGHAHCFGCGWHGDVIDFLDSLSRRDVAS